MRSELEEERRALAAAAAEAGSPVLLQMMVGESLPTEAPARAAWDLSPALLADDLEALRSLPAGADAVWPLVAGLTDGEDVVEEGLAALAATGVRAVQGMRLELSPRARRMLAAGGDEELFDRLFHGPPPSERAFARRAAAAGLEPFVPRPLPAAPPRLVTRRRVAGELRLAAELWHRLERPEARGHALLRAARWVDDEDVDLEALVAGDNLAIVEPVDELGRRVIEEHLGAGRSSLLDELLNDYLAGDEG